MAANPSAVESNVSRVAGLHAELLTGHTGVRITGTPIPEMSDAQVAEAADFGVQVAQNFWRCIGEDPELSSGGLVRPRGPLSSLCDACLVAAGAAASVSQGSLDFEALGREEKLVELVVESYRSGGPHLAWAFREVCLVRLRIKKKASARDCP